MNGSDGTADFANSVSWLTADLADLGGAGSIAVELNGSNACVQPIKITVARGSPLNPFLTLGSSLVLMKQKVVQLYKNSTYSIKATFFIIKLPTSNILGSN